jgi:PAS domain S-box-containing protein
MAKLVVSFLVLSVAMVAIVGVVAYLRARSSLETSVFDRLEAASELKTGSLDRWIDEQRRNVVFVAGLLGGYETGDSVTSLNRDVQALLEGTLDGAEAAQARADIDSVLSYMVSKTADAQEFLVLDPDGSIVVSTVEEHEGLSQRNEDYFLNGSSNTYDQPVSATDLSSAPVITIATPLFARGGERIAVLAANLNLDRLDRIVLEQTGLGTSGETYLVGEDGRFVHSRLTSEYPDPVTSQGIEQGLRQVDGEALYANYDGEPVIGVYRWFDETGSALLAEMSQEEAFAPARQLALVIGLIGLAVVAVLGLGIYGISRRIARPILAITDTATAVSAGDLTREAPVTTNDEVGTLAVAFNEMTSQLRENVETLEQRVDERTAELSTALEAQREAEAEIRRQKQYFEELVEISPAAVVTMGIDERVTGWNPAATRLFGYTPEEALGRTVDELVLGSESQLEEGNAVAREAVESGQASRITQRTRKDGSLVDVEILVVPLVIDGERVGSYAIYHDIGELQEARQQATRPTRRRAPSSPR